MKKKLTTYFILLSYLALFIANIFHYHSISFNKNYFNEVSEQDNGLYAVTHHSALNCPVQNTFNNLHNFSSVIQQNSDYIAADNEKQILIKSDFSKSNSSHYTFSLRAPPILLS